MKKFTRIVICLLLCFVSIGFVGCGDNRTPKEKAFTYPVAVKTEDVISNGGIAVRTGDYIFCVNGYIEGEASSWSSSYQNASFGHGGLLLIKLEDGEIVTDENNLLKDEYFIYMSNMLAGFNATSLHLEGNYLYFTAVSRENEGGKKHTWARNRVEIWRVSLNKTSCERVFQSNVATKGVETKFYSNNGSVVAFVVEKSSGSNSDVVQNLYRVNCNSGAVQGLGTISSVVYGENKVTYTKTEDSVNGIYLVDALSGAGTSEAILSSSNSLKVEDIKNNSVYFIENEILKSCAFDGTNVKDVFKYIEVYSDYIILPAGQVMVVQGNNLLLTDGVMDLYQDYKISDESGIASIVGVANGNLIYVDSSSDKNVKMVSYDTFIQNINANNGENIVVTEDNIIAQVNDSSIAKFDLSDDDAYMYFFNMVGDHYYTQRVKINNRYATDEVETIGVYLSGDAPEVEEETEE